MSVKKKLLLTLFTVLFFCILIYAVLISLYAHLPDFLEYRVLPKTARDAGISDFSCHVRRVGLHSADLSDLRIGTVRRPALYADSVHLEYFPGELNNYHIRKVIFSGIQLFCSYEQGAFTFPFFDLPVFSGEPVPEDDQAPESGTVQSLSVDLLEIRHAVMIWSYEEKTYRIPFDLQIKPVDQTWHLLNCRGAVYPMGTEISADAEIHTREGRIHLALRSEGLRLERLSDFSSLIPDLMVWGKADIAGEADLLLSPFRLTHARADCILFSGTITHPRFALRNALSAENEMLPLHLELTGKDLDHWALAGNGIAMVFPLPLELSDLNCSFNLEEHAFHGSGQCVVTTGPDFAKHLPAVETLPVMRSRADFSLTTGESLQWSMTLQDEARGDAVSTDSYFEASAGSFEMKSSRPELDLSSKGSGNGGAASFSLVFPRVHVSGTGEDIDIPAVTLSGKADFQYADGVYSGHADYRLHAPESKAVSGTSNVYMAECLLTGKADFRHLDGRFQGNTDFSLSAADSEFKNDATVILMPDLTLAGNLGTDTRTGHRFQGTLDFSNATLFHPWQNTEIRGIKGRIPCRWPCEDLSSEGHIAIESILWDKKSLGSVQGSLRQTESGLQFKGQHESLLFPDLALDITVNSDIFSPRGPEAKIRFALPPYTPASEIDLGRILPWIAGVGVQGEMALQGVVRLDLSGMHGWLDTSLDNASIRYPPGDIAIEGIQMSLSFPDLFHLRSGPGQLFTFKNASLSGLQISDGKIAFQFEGPGSFFLERSSFRWCDGNIETQAMRIQPGVHDYDLVLYCDRLSFAKILEQTGVLSATGTGTLNGRIPIRFKDGMITVQDGFLFSTPGEGGNIRITGTDFLNTLVPSDNLQMGQIQIAREAIKDYEYDWAKLWLNTVGDTMIMQLKLNGKPAGPLPFVYNKEQGRFIKVDMQSKGSIFQGIQLDVNFRLPINKVLYYGDLVREIYKMSE